MPSMDAIYRRIIELDAQFRGLTGREGFSYSSHPTGTSDRFVFGDGTVKTSAQEALAYMMRLVELARTMPQELPYPFDQGLTPGQDRRRDESWVRARLALLDD